MSHLAPAFCPPACGFFGKVPAQPDFVHQGLAESTLTALDLWCRESLLEISKLCGAHWRNLWMVAPVWSFLLPAGVWGPNALLGAWMPSMDTVGRCYPFILCACAPTLSLLTTGGAWLEQSTQAALACVVNDQPTDTLHTSLTTPAPPTPLPVALGWWTQGGPFVRPAQATTTRLPPPLLVTDKAADTPSAYSSTEVR